MKEVLVLYKEILTRTKLLPPNEVRRALFKTKKKFRENKDLELTMEHIKEAKNRLSYLKMITPRTKSDMRNEREKMKETFIIKDGELIEGTGSAIPTQGFKDKRDDTEEYMRRHNQLLRRQHFMDRE